MRYSHTSTKIPPHPQAAMNFTIDTSSREARGMYDSFNYIAPVVKYNPAAMQPGPVYRGGEAAAVGHQPYNYTDSWTAYSQPRSMPFAYLHGYKGTQSTASFAVAQNTIANMLSVRSGGG